MFLTRFAVASTFVATLIITSVGASNHLAGFTRVDDDQAKKVCACADKSVSPVIHEEAEHTSCNCQPPDDKVAVYCPGRFLYIIDGLYYYVLIQCPSGTPINGLICYTSFVPSGCGRAGCNATIPPKEIIINDQPYHAQRPDPIEPDRDTQYPFPHELPVVPAVDAPIVVQWPPRYIAIPNPALHGDQQNSDPKDPGNSRPEKIYLKLFTIEVRLPRPQEMTVHLAFQITQPPGHIDEPHAHLDEFQRILRVYDKDFHISHKLKLEDIPGNDPVEP